MGCNSSRASSKSNTQLTFREKYNTGAKLGEGAFGVVHECFRRANPSQPYAVKMIDKVEQDQEEIEREVAMLQSLDHPNVIKTLDVFQEKCFVCIVMDKYSGGDLVDGLHLHLRSKGKIKPTSLIPIISQMAASIDYLHERNIIHRDVKGDNFLMDDPDISKHGLKIVLSDFGTALKIESDQILSEHIGTRAFWSPEFCLRKYTFPADVWACGIIMYGLLDGTFPFKDETQILEKKPRIPVAPTAAQDLVKKLLEKDPTKRPSSKEFMRHKWLEGEAPESAKDVVACEKQSTGSADKGDRDKDEGGMKIQEKEGVPEALAQRRMELIQRLEKQAKNQQNKDLGTKTKTNRETLEKMRSDFQTDGIRAGDKHSWGWVRPEDHPTLKCDDKTVVTDANDTIWTPEILEQQLQKHKINTLNFGKGKAKTLSELTDECSRAECVMMQDANEHSKLVRVVDVVLLRIKDKPDGNNPKILVETKETFKDGRDRATERLPGTKTRPHENTKDTILRIIDTVLKMSPQKFEFKYSTKELSEQEEESPSYPGIHTVYRKHFVEGYITTKDPETKKLIGLPGGETFQTVADDSGITKTFEWLTVKSCHEKKVKLEAEKADFVFSSLVDAVMKHSKESVQAHLQRFNIDTSKFGLDEARTLTEFANEMSQGESYLLEQNGGILRAVDVVLLRVTSDDDKILLEKNVRYADGRVIDTNRLPGIKRRPNENVYSAARRIIRTFLQLDEGFLQLKPGQVELIQESKESPSYPGVRTCYRKHIISGTFGTKKFITNPNVTFLD